MSPKTSKGTGNISDSPYLFRDISESYLKAYDIIWAAELEMPGSLGQNTGLALRPMCQLLGQALELSMKACALAEVSKYPIFTTWIVFLPNWTIPK
ncbi:MAG: hypothetical protein AAGB10_04635 [Pseudomonadota bacterium]